MIKHVDEAVYSTIKDAATDKFTPGAKVYDLKSNGVAKSGYNVTLAADAGSGTVAMSTVSTCNASAGVPTSSYWASANPVTPGGTGTRYFATDTRGTIFYATAAVLANPIASTASVVQ